MRRQRRRAPVSTIRRTTFGTMATYQQHSSTPSTTERVATMISEWEQRTGEVASPEFIAQIAAQIS